MENLIEAVAAWVNLQWIRENDKNCDGQLSNGDEDRSGRVHRNNVGSNLPGGEGYKRDLEAPVQTLEPKVR